MKYTFDQFQDRLPTMEWDIQELANKLSSIGHETEVADNNLDVTLTSNRKDCKDFSFLLFDLAGVYSLKLIDSPQGFRYKPEISVTPERINELLGSNVTWETIKGLERLGFIVTETGVQPPDFRDVSSTADIAEEILRLIGYDALTIEPLSEQTAPESQDYTKIQSIKYALANAGWTETATSSFSANGLVELKNPFTETEPFMRPTLLEGLLQTLAKNRFMKKTMFFEIGKTFSPEEKLKLGLIISGIKDVTEISNTVSTILGCQIDFTDKEVSNEIIDRFEAKQGLVKFIELDIDELKPNTNNESDFISQPLTAFNKISKFPPLTIDHNIVSDEVADQVTKQAKAIFPELLIIESIDSYTHPETGITTVTLRFIFQQQEQSFTEAEIYEVRSRLERFIEEANKGKI